MDNGTEKKKNILIRIIIWIIIIPIVFYSSIFLSALISGVSINDIKEQKLSIIYSGNMIIKRLLPSKTIDFDNLMEDYDTNSVLALKKYNNKYYKFYLFVSDNRPSTYEYASNPKDYYIVKIYDSNGYRDKSIVSNSIKKYETNHDYQENYCYDEWSINDKTENNYWMWRIRLFNDEDAINFVPGRLYEIKGCLSIQPSTYDPGDIYCSIFNAKIVKVV